MTIRPTASPARPVVEDVRPRVPDGDFEAKAVAGDVVTVEADVFLDGHDLLRVELLHRRVGTRAWTRSPMRPIGNDRWRGQFVPPAVGHYQFQVEAGVDRFSTWLRDLAARLSADQDISVEILVGAEIARLAAAAAKGSDRRRLDAFADDLADGNPPDVNELNDGLLVGLVSRYAPGPTTSTATYGVHAERPRARFSTWYELFPRSTATRRGKHGTLLTVIDRLDYLERLGVDVLYLPPIHPIGTTARKGRNGATTAKKGDVGSPWAIGSSEGGHTAVHPELGTVEDLRTLVAAAHDHGIEVALDIAYQCSPDHPWVTEHPEWFTHRPDGSIRYAENPPKRYEDIYPINFESEDWRALWDALREVVEFWIAAGVRIFRVDNPHTKPFAFWEWLIPAVQADHDDVLFLAEAFTRPKVMKRLAKLGFTQSYTYFAWRTEKWEFEQYLTELTQTDAADYFRPNFWPNTPDILTEQLQHGTRETFLIRATLAGTLAASYGVYGPVFELLERAPRHAGSEEYLDSEKYQVRSFKLDSPVSIAPFLARLNRVRREQLALQHNATLAFHYMDNPLLMAYSKTAEGVGPASAAEDVDVDLAGAPVLVVVNLDPDHQQSGWIHLDLAALGVDPDQPFVVHDLLSTAVYEWKGDRSFVILNPASSPAHLFRIEPAPEVLR